MTDRFMMAAIQAAPVLYDRDASVAKACQLILEAGERGATIAAFGESWIPGFPLHMFRRPREPLHWKANAVYLENAVTVPSPSTDLLCNAAKKAGIDVVIGIVELDARTQGTTYCTLLFIGKDGTIIGKHRKLKPTYTERAVWGDGDAKGLHAIQRPYARISGLNCWEHQMVLPTYALAQSGTQIHVAAWPGGEFAPDKDELHPHYSRQTLLSRAFASQAGCYVILAAGMRAQKDMPEAFSEFEPVMHPGHSLIIDPRGEIIAGPAEGETMLFAEGSLEQVRIAKSMCDIAGHYSRPDIFKFEVTTGAP